MTGDLALMPATELLQYFRTRKASPVEAVRAAFARIHRHNGRTNAFCLLDEEGALAEARRSEKRWFKGDPKGRLDGVPTTIKDMFLTRGWPTLRGSRLTKAEGPWEEDSPLVARLREHGAVFLGKTTQPEFGWKGVTDSSLHGVTRNPWNDMRTSGGSSGGAAVAAALGMGTLHAGGDGAGSIRIPAAFCGIFGLKPSFGRVPNYPAKMPGSITHAGPMTRTVADAALMLTVMAEPDYRDWQSLPYQERNFSADLQVGVGGLRIAFAASLGLGSTRPEIAAMAKKATERFADLGATVEEIELDLKPVRSAFELYYYVRFARLHAMLSEGERRMLDPGIVNMAGKGRRYTTLDMLDADAVREEIALQMRLLHQRYDLLMTPQMPLTAFEAGRDVPLGGDYVEWLDWSPFTYPFNFTQQPAASVPCGLAADGLPVGLQIVADRYRDDLVLRASRAFETMQPFILPDGVGPPGGTVGAGRYTSIRDRRKGNE